MTEIICLLGTGKARAGKETVARMLKEELVKADKRVLITHFADPLKLICRNWFNWDGRMNDEGRSLLHYVGTDIVRARLPNFWVDFTLSLLSIMGDEWDYVIIPDCRWPNELDFERHGFRTRHIQIESRRVATGVHTPERLPGKSAPEFIIVNDESSPDKLRREVEAVAQCLIFG